MTDPRASDLKTLLDFWFDPATMPHWFDGGPDFDRTCRERFAALVEDAVGGALDSWQDSADGCVGLCLLLDQMPRNLYRGTPRAFATDDRAQAVAEAALARGFDQMLAKERRLFLYMPFMHSEQLADQERSVLLFEALGIAASLPFAIEHAEVIRRFGRFPHRNGILGRASTAAEVAYLEDAPNYGQAVADPGSAGPV